MEPNTVKVADSFQIDGHGTLAELQHKENGIPSGTIVTDPESGNSWIIKKRIFSGILLITDSETYFDCETEIGHIDSTYLTKEAEEEAIKIELKKREEGTFGYLLSALNKNGGPEAGVFLKIKEKI